MAGIFAHAIDLPRLICSLSLKGAGTQAQLVVDSRAKDVLESFLLALDQMYRAVYFHKTVRAATHLASATLKRARFLGSQGKAWEDALFPAPGGVEDPLWSLLRDGDRTKLDVYRYTDEALVWAKLPMWSRCEDATLAELSSRILARKFPKALELPGEEGLLHSGRLVEIAREETRQLFPKLDADYFVCLDSPSRLSYKRYRVGEGPAGAIQVLLPDGSTRAVEDDRESIVGTLIQNKILSPRLLVLPEVRDRLRSNSEAAAMLRSK